MLKPKLLLLISLIITALLFTACEEVGPAVNLEPKPAEEVIQSETTPVKQSRRVILEEFTGVKCTNCPKGHEIVADFVSELGLQFTSVAIHPGGHNLTWMADHSVQDLTTEKGGRMFQQFGSGGLPAGMIDRVHFATESQLALTFSKWAARVQERLMAPTGCNISMDSQLFESSDSLAITITIDYTEDLDEDHFITVGITEDDIIEAQKQPDATVIENYRHKHVLRKVLTGFQGDIIIGQNEPKTKGLTVIRRYSLTDIPEEWNRENLGIYAMVHRRGEVKEVLQSAAIHWPE